MRRLQGLLAALFVLLPAAAFPQGSQRTIEIIVPFAPGASADGIARIVANGLGDRLNRQVVVENRAGAGGVLGLMAVAKAPPDGDLLTVAATGALVVAPHIAGAPPIDPLRDVAPVAKLIDIPVVLVANPRVGPKTVKELIARGKNDPNGVSYGSMGVNSGGHLGVALLGQATGAKFIHVPYRGSTPAVTDLLGGQIPVAAVDLTSALPHIRSGGLIALGLLDNRRTSVAPEIPTIAEAGVPGFGNEPGFIGLFAPPATPPPILKTLTVEIAAILAKPDVQEKARLLAAQVSYLDNVAFGKFLAVESAKWKTALASLGLSN
jgi:tripartite-type tricarboxylate transporter receptor subunit TctC